MSPFVAAVLGAVRAAWFHLVRIGSLIVRNLSANLAGLDGGLAEL